MNKILNQKTCPRQRLSAIPAVTFRQNMVVFNIKATEILQLDGERVSFKLLSNNDLVMYFDHKNGFVVTLCQRRGRKNYTIFNKILVGSIKATNKGQSAIYEIGVFSEGGWPLKKI